MPKRDPSPPAAADILRGRTLGLLALLGALSSLWALYLWTELVRFRTGGTPFCAFGESDCGTLWDAGFARGVQTLTGLPVAAWGLIWGLVAFLLPLAALVAAYERRQSGDLEASVRVAGIAGVAGVGLLLAASAVEGLFCSSCALTYLLTLGYGTLAILGLQKSPSRSVSSGLLIAAATTVASYLLLLYPGLQTPGSVIQAGEQALAEVAGPRFSSPGAAPSTVPDADRQLAELIASLPPSARQVLSDSIFIYENSPQVAQQPPRALQGSIDAPVRITEFTDVLCSHCAALHGTLSYLRSVLPANSFSVEARQFPLDGNCNPRLPVQGPVSVRCLASRAKICLESSGQAPEVAEALYARQQDLTPELVFETLTPFVERAELEICLASQETTQKLLEDIDYAWRFEPDGTPLVLVNGRRGTSFGPFLYAMLLTGGSTAHPALSELPPPNPHAHVH